MNYTPKRHCRRSKYCAPKCRAAAWREKKQAENRKEIEAVRLTFEDYLKDITALAENYRIAIIRAFHSIGDAIKRTR